MQAIERFLLKCIYSELLSCWAPRFSQDFCLSLQGLTYYLSMCQFLMSSARTQGQCHAGTTSRRDSVRRHWPRQASWRISPVGSSLPHWFLHCVPRSTPFQFKAQKSLPRPLLFHALRQKHRSPVCRSSPASRLLVRDRRGWGSASHTHVDAAVSH